MRGVYEGLINLQLYIVKNQGCQTNFPGFFLETFLFQSSSFPMITLHTINQEKEDTHESYHRITRP